MAKVFIYPTTSLILSDLVARFGHQPLSAALQVREKIQTAGLESPPLQITPEDPKKGLKYAAVEVPSGVRGRSSFGKPRVPRGTAIPCRSTYISIILPLLSRASPGICLTGSQGFDQPVPEPGAFPPSERAREVFKIFCPFSPRIFQKFPQ